MISLKQIVIRARARMEDGRLVLREARPEGVTPEQYAYWPIVKFELVDGEIFYTYDPWGGKALPHKGYVYTKIKKRMIDENDFDGLLGIRDDWVLKALDFTEEEVA